MAVDDAEPRYRLLDQDDNLVGSIYFDTGTDQIKAAFDDGTDVVIAEK